MGCNKSQPVSKIIQPPSLPFLSPKKRFSMTKNKLLTKGIKSMKEYFEIISALGTSGEGNLLYARDVHTGTYRTIREISKSTGSQNIKLLQEVNIISELDHPNILKVYQTIETNRSYYVVLENADGGLLQNKIKKSGDEALVAKYMSEVFQAINYLHVNNIIHCNLHLGNILLSDSSDLGIPKIVGFRHSQRTIDMQDIDIKLLNYEYISPEILNYKFDEKTDIWSAGVILYMLLVGKLPFAGRSKKEVLESIFKCDLDFNNPNFLTLSYNARDLLKKILISDPYVRLSAKEILAHPWLAQSSKETSVTYEVIEKLRRFKVIII
jgi:calcium-dependent protein kinase